MYYRIQETINSMYGVIDNPDNVGQDISFLAGQFIKDTFSSPLIFTIDHPKNKAPRHFLGDVIPLASKAFIESLEAAGIDNFQTFPAVLHQTATGIEHNNYFALNIIGLVDAVDIEKSTYDIIMQGDNGIPELVDFNELVFPKKKPAT